MCEVLGAWSFQTKSALFRGTEFGLDVDRRLVGEDGTCGFVSALKRFKVGLLTLFAFQHWMPGICRKIQTNLEKTMLGSKVPFLDLSSERLYVQLDIIPDCG